MVYNNNNKEVLCLLRCCLTSLYQFRVYYNARICVFVCYLSVILKVSDTPTSTIFVVDHGK